ncbi:hypothetical protein [Sphingosinicella sp. CPCC 101087]|uniref:DUF6958 family protein n=1 Tax=Sphingosinicella sp. CPCC 101087 TaxID=2497754 RepID=UPI00101D2468|nr:hypothetical protein [Sphingosinicella sp. CPCC 101087]
MPETGAKMVIENAASPGHSYRVDRAKYEAMRDALMAVLPAQPPGMTVADAKAALLPHLDDGLFPGGAKAGWWLKAVHLDLEAKGAIGRSAKPVRLFRLSGGA